MLQRLLKLIKKELQVLLGSNSSRMMLIMPVVFQTLLFPFAGTMEVRNTTIVVFNQDSGQASREFLQRLEQTQAFANVVMVHEESRLRDAIDNQRALLALRIGPGFSKDIKAGNIASVQIVIDGRRSNSGQIASGYINEILGNYADELSTGTKRPSPVVRNLYNPNLDFKWLVLPSLVVILTTVGCLTVTAMSVAREREEGTFDQILVSPLTPVWIMIGKAIPGILVAIAQGSFVALIARWIFGVPFTGSVTLLIFGMACYGLALSGIGLFISSLCSTQQQAFLGVFAFMAPSVILSGYVTPVENMPSIFRWISHVDPLFYMILVVKGLFLKDFGFYDVWQNIWPMLTMSVFTLSAALYMFRRHVA